MVVFVYVIFWGLVIYLFKSQITEDRLKNKFYKEFGSGGGIKIIIEIENSYILYDNNGDKCRCSMSVKLYLPTLDGKTLHPAILNNKVILGERTSPFWGESWKGLRKKIKKDFYSKRFEEPNYFCLSTKIKLTDFILDLKKICYCEPVFELRLTEASWDGSDYPIGFVSLMNSEDENYQRWLDSESMFPPWMAKENLD
jgi:hypothetical protein